MYESFLKWQIFFQGKRIKNFPFLYAQNEKNLFFFGSMERRKWRYIKKSYIHMMENAVFPLFSQKHVKNIIYLYDCRYQKIFRTLQNLFLINQIL